VSSRESARSKVLGRLRGRLEAFCLERWQSLHENFARVNMSESGVFPLRLADLEELGLRLEDLKDLELSYGWTRGSPELRERISELYGGEVSAEEVLVTAGSAEANFSVLISTVEDGDLAFVDLPNYMQLPGLLKFLGARAEALRRSHPSWRFPIEKALEKIEAEKPKAVFICNPNNPTGKVMKEEELEELGEAARKAGSMLIFDEVYWGSELDGERPSALEVIGKDFAVSVSGLSKVYGLPGLRIGWIAGRRELIERAWSVKDYLSISPSVLSDRIASAVLTSISVQKLRERARSIVKKNLELFSSKAKGDLLDPVIPEGGAFIWVKIPWEDDTLALSEELFSSYGILVNPGECFESPGFLRIGIGQESTAFSRSLDELLAGLLRIRETRL